jgi:hypothetical protein
MTITQNAMQVGEEIGWTKASNLRDGCSDLFFTPTWIDKRDRTRAGAKADSLGQRCW